jgi:hypothetical protein
MLFKNVQRCLNMSKLRYNSHAHRIQHLELRSFIGNQFFVPLSLKTCCLKMLKGAWTCQNLDTIHMLIEFNTWNLDFSQEINSLCPFHSKHVVQKCSKMLEHVEKLFEKVWCDIKFIIIWKHYNIIVVINGHLGVTSNSNLIFWTLTLIYIYICMFISIPLTTIW